MDIAAHIDSLEHEGVELAHAAAAVSLGAPVPGCPEWSVRDLVRHVGYVHRWAGAIVDGRLDGAGGDGDAAVGPLPEDDGLHEWYAEGHRALIEILRSAPPDVECFTFLPAPSPLAFWARRQALETAVHRADLATAAGLEVEFGDDLALDGIDETLRGFGSRPRAFEPGSIWLQPGAAPGWRIDLHEEGLSASNEATPDGCDVALSGTPSQVYLWLWNRPATVDVTGDPAVAERWKRVRVRWS
jgi:uncharacterized protein (TIGR03083 family)